MNWSKYKLMMGIKVAVVVALVIGVRPLLAVDDLGLFELDGDVINDVISPEDDWESLYNGDGNSIVFTGIMADPCETTIFAGGKKDIQDIDDWNWKNGGGFPDKDDITNAYGAAYLADGNLIAYFGADRYANNGDAFLGFWFFQDNVSLNPDGTFNGHHEVGDILVIVNYPQATTKSPEIDVVEWNPSEADVAKNLKILYQGVLCTGSGGYACAITNMSEKDSLWPYTPKSGTDGKFPYESFFEGGINLTELLNSTRCFASFMAESRSSEKFTATLKDFVLGEFPVCDISVSKSCTVTRLTDQNDVTDKFFVVQFDGTVTNTGAAPLPAGALLEVVDDAGTPMDTSDDVVIQKMLDNPTGVGDSIPFSGQFFSNDNPPYNTVTASILASSFSVVADPCSVNCSNLVLDPNLSLSKLCWTRLETIESILIVKVYFSGDVCNTGDVPLNVTVTDNKAGIVLPQTLIKPGECATIEGSYYPVSANGDVNNPCAAVFGDTFTAVGVSSIPGIEEQVEKITANCPLCDCP